MTAFFCHHPSPIGDLMLVSDGSALTGLWMEDKRWPPRAGGDWLEDAGPFGEAREQLDAYFRGERTAFDLELAPSGTEFQRRVWRALREIPYGETISYAQLARRVGNPAAVRAVGAANGRNPISIVVPCHRVIGSDGSLTGFGGGLDRKRALLELESRRRGQAALPWD